MTRLGLRAVVASLLLDAAAHAAQHFAEWWAARRVALWGPAAAQALLGGIPAVSADRRMPRLAEAVDWPPSATGSGLGRLFAFVLRACALACVARR